MTFYLLNCIIKSHIKYWDVYIMKIVIVSPKNRTAYNFRGDLIKRIVACGHEVTVTGPNRENVERIEELGAAFVEISVDKNGINPFNDLKYQNALFDLFKREKPDIVFGYTSKPIVYGSIAAKRAGVPYIVSMVTGVGYAFTSQSKKAKIIKLVLSFLYKIAFRCTDTVVFQNPDDLREFVDKKLVSKEKCHVVNGSGVNMKKFPVAEYPEQLTFLMLSRVMYSKGIREYLEACKTVKSQYPDVRFMLLGKCENIQDSISEDELKPYIDSGIVEHFGETDRVSDYYKQCSVYVLPSYREGTPRTVLEAMSMGRAIITTDSPGCRETVIDGRNGFLVPIKDAQAVADKMIEFIKNPNLISIMGKESVSLCREKYDVDKVNDDMCKYLKI